MYLRLMSTVVMAVAILLRVGGGGMSLWVCRGPTGWGTYFEIVSTSVGCVCWCGPMHSLPSGSAAEARPGNARQPNDYWHCARWFSGVGSYATCRVWRPVLERMPLSAIATSTFTCVWCWPGNFIVREAGIMTARGHTYHPAPSSGTRTARSCTRCAPPRSHSHAFTHPPPTCPPQTH